MSNYSQHSNDVDKAKDGSSHEVATGALIFRGKKLAIVTLMIVSGVLILAGGKMAVEVYEQQLKVTSEKIQTLEKKLSQYKDVDLNSSELRQQFEILQDRVDHLGEQFARFDQKIIEIKNSDAGDRGWEPKYRRLAAQVDTLRREVHSLRETNPSTQFGTSRALFTLSRLRANLIQGRACSTELEIMRSFVKETPALTDRVEALSLSCEKGVLTETELQKTFPAVARAVMQTNDMAEDTKWWKRFSSILTSLVSVRPVGPQVLGQSPAALLARTEVFLAAGDLAGALATIEQLAVTKGVGLEWTEGLAARIFAIRETDKIANVLMAATIADDD